MIQALDASADRVGDEPVVDAVQPTILKHLGACQDELQSFEELLEQMKAEQAASRKPR